MKFSGIYQIQSKKKPDRIYIGSGVIIQRRWWDHLRTLRKGIHYNGKLQNHFNKYGESDLQFSVLVGCPKEDLIKTEQYFIDAFKPYFNICKIAGSVVGFPSWSKGTKGVIKANSGSFKKGNPAHKGKPFKKKTWKHELDEEHRKSISEGMKVCWAKRKAM